MLHAGWEAAEDGSLWRAIGASTFRACIGSLIGFLFAVVIGVGAGFSRIGELIFDKPVQMIRSIPFTALVPLFILWFGIGEEAKILLVVWAVFIPLYLNTFSGIRNVDRRLVEVAKVYKLSPLEISLRVLLHGALPSVLVGLRYSLGLGWAVLIVAESVNAKNGIGAMLSMARQYAQTDVVLLCISLYAILGLITDLLVRLLEDRLLQWRTGYIAQ
ncbi:ABC transporter permease subunit [Bradyrhizobium sp. dw_78]|uniref:ABC transporter permease n=1 Tax=Bradyrhizobium sp. dw_78 TaxID=2719793 RepID=UPI001BD49F94